MGLKALSYRWPTERLVIRLSGLQLDKFGWEGRLALLGLASARVAHCHRNENRLACAEGNSGGVL